MHGRTLCHAPALQLTLMVVHPALNRPLTPAAENADLMTAPQKGLTASDQSAVLISCGGHRARGLGPAALTPHFRMRAGATTGQRGGTKEACL